MAQRVQVSLTCDVHDGDVEGAETVLFALDGAAFEIDLCEQHANELREDLADFIQAGRKAGKTGTGPRRRASTSAPASTADGGAGGGHDLAKVREWASANGMTVSARGRIAGSVLAAYDAAH